MAEESINEEESVVDRIKESPRTVSAVIIILIVAAAIYAFSGEEVSPEGTTDTGEVVAAGQDGETPGDSNTLMMGEDGESDVDNGSINGASTEVMEPLPEPRKTNEGYMEVAQPGEGVTHLARRATAKWLSENQTSYEVTDEHRIYIEDYIQNKVGSEGLGIGETRTVGYDLVQEAVAAAEQLNQSQLDNLSQYTYVLQ